MTTVAFTSGYTVTIDTTASPATYQAVEEVHDIGGLGVTNELVDVTHFGSAGAKEYIGGLADGSDFTFTCNKVQTAASTQSLVYDMVDNKETRSVQVTVTDGTTAETYTFSLVMLSYELGGDPADKATVTFGGKVSGAITRA